MIKLVMWWVSWRPSSLADSSLSASLIAIIGNSDLWPHEVALHTADGVQHIHTHLACAHIHTHTRAHTRAHTHSSWQIFVFCSSQVFCLETQTASTLICWVKAQWEESKFCFNLKRVTESLDEEKRKKLKTRGMQDTSLIWQHFRNLDSDREQTTVHLQGLHIYTARQLYLRDDSSNAKSVSNI